MIVKAQKRDELRWLYPWSLFIRNLGRKLWVESKISLGVGAGIWGRQYIIKYLDKITLLYTRD